MKKILTILLATAMVLTMAACSVQIGGDSTETWEYSADNKEDSIELFNMFFEGTDAAPDKVIKMKNNGNDIFTENISGTSDYVIYTGQAAGTRTYAFINDAGEYEYVMNTESDGATVMTGEEEYGWGYEVYKTYFFFLGDGEEEYEYSATLSGQTVTSNGNEETTETFEMKITVVSGEMAGESVTVSGTSTAKLVNYLSVENTSESDNTKYEFEFSYGKDAVAAPEEGFIPA